LKLNLRIEYISTGAKEVTCSASDLVAFETKFNLSVTKLGEETKLTHLLFLAWASEKRTKATALEFDSWIDTVVTVGASDLDPK
jgi:hypothetical protein